ncbi:MAG: sulfopyruvate decarboxylase subunit alpha [Deltaproteobacteria bacterium]|nr:sulfopyruvate decarboxylase subunit alpha [Deltaproteobacteria bacterium]
MTIEDPSRLLFQKLRAHRIDAFVSVPCSLLDGLLRLIHEEKDVIHIPVTREEEGLGILAGATLAGRRPALVAQNSGLGNSINAICSLTNYFELPTVFVISHRGSEGERIDAQLPMGAATIPLLDAVGVSSHTIGSAADLSILDEAIPKAFEARRSVAFLFPFSYWSCGERSEPAGLSDCEASPPETGGLADGDSLRPGAANSPPQPEIGAKEEKTYRRFEALELIMGHVSDELVVVNIGHPAQEVFRIKDRPKNFYMLGSMGLASSIGLGLAMSTKDRVVAIDGDGSVLMNLGTLATIGVARPSNLVLIVIDNESYGSTGFQKTLTASGVDLTAIARACQIPAVFEARGEAETRAVLERVMARREPGPVCVVLKTEAGKAEGLKPIPLDAEAIKLRFKRAIHRE